MAKIIAHFSKKVGLPDYSSQQASASIEVEVANNDPEALKTALRRLYSIARESVDEQLAQSGQPAPTQQGTNRVGQASTPARPNGNGNGGNGNGGKPGNGNGRYVPATQAQKKAIFAICKSIGIDPALHNADMSVKEASGLIDKLKAQQTNR